MTIEQRLDNLEKRNKRLTVALTMTVVTMCAVVTMGISLRRDKVFGDCHFDSVTARRVSVENDAGEFVVNLGADEDGDALVFTRSAKGKELVRLSSSDSGGLVYVYNKTGEFIAEMSADVYGNGVVGAYSREGEGSVW